MVVRIGDSAKGQRHPIRGVPGYDMLYDEEGRDMNKDNGYLYVDKLHSANIHP